MKALILILLVGMGRTGSAGEASPAFEARLDRIAFERSEKARESRETKIGNSEEDGETRICDRRSDHG